MLLDDRQHATESSHIASTKEVVEDKTAKSNTDITSVVSHTRVIVPRTWRNLLPQRTRERFDDQRRSMDSHEIQWE